MKHVVLLSGGDAEVPVLRPGLCPWQARAWLQSPGHRQHQPHRRGPAGRQVQRGHQWSRGQWSTQWRGAGQWVLQRGSERGAQHRQGEALQEGQQLRAASAGVVRVGQPRASHPHFAQYLITTVGSRKNDNRFINCLELQYGRRDENCIIVTHLWCNFTYFHHLCLCHLDSINFII